MNESKMGSKPERWRNIRNVLQLTQCREINAEAANLLRQKAQFTKSFIERLGIEVELEGHQGCVNCLEWSPNGLHLVSGSDDTKVIVWDPFRHKQLNVISTPHYGNIFSVKFLADENVIATAAGDCRVVVQSVEGSAQKKAPLLDCSCHTGRVKRLATCPDQPTLFWSAGEDGLVLQYDLREPHECPTKSKILIDLSSKSEIKCVAVNPTKPHYLAIGANDCFVRLYDRRMMKPVPAHLSFDGNRTKRIPSEPLIDGCVQYYAPGHLAKENAGTVSIKLAVTHVAFNSAGSEILANVGGEQIYLFDINNSRHINELKIPQYPPRRQTSSEKVFCGSQQGTNYGSCLLANSNGGQECSCAYMKRAFDYYRRRWSSDLYCAAREYLYVIRHWPDKKLAILGLIRCLVALKWEEEANDWLKYLLRSYPECSSMPQLKVIKSELLELKNSPKDDNSDAQKVEEDEKNLRLDSLDFEKRYLGHCNTTTDIKEANFLGDGDNFICAGSDEGIIFIWDKSTSEITRALFGDTSIVNCIQPHPSACVIASSGIDTAVKIWSPMAEDDRPNNRIVNCIPIIVEANQKRMSMDPFESMLASMGYQIQTSGLDLSIQDGPTCRTS